MRIGFATIYSWRPHVEHTWYLARLAQQAGHETRFLSCDGKLPTCYTRELRDRAKLIECFTCQLGGLRSYTSTGLSQLSDFFTTHSQEIPAKKEWSFSSASTLKRFEAPSDYESDEFYELTDRLNSSVQLVFRAALNWIAQERIEGLCLFNGRMEVTRALFEAAKLSNIPVVTHERTWFGDGIQLFPEEHCLSLKPVRKMVSDWRDKPLTRAQALVAASRSAQRFLKVNLTEWRAYNLKATQSDWPNPNPGVKVLILPSSTNEIWGHDDWKSQWPTVLDGFSSVLRRLHSKSVSPVLRCHPNWSEKIGKRDGALPEAYYSGWAKEQRIPCIPSSNSADTLDLIRQADYVLVSVSSAALDAAILGKKVISVSPSVFEHSGFVLNIFNPEDLHLLNSFETLSAREIIRRALRFTYTVSGRLPQYVNFIRAKNSSDFNFFVGADPSRFCNLFVEKELKADDIEFALSGESEENEIIEMLTLGKWKSILDLAQARDSSSPQESIKRKPYYRWIDRIRSLAAPGDR